MKRCPECMRDYYDDSLLYCLDDGMSLLDGPAADQSKTVLLNRAVSWTGKLDDRPTGLHKSFRNDSPDSNSGFGERIVGRSSELADLDGLLANDDIRLITLTGIGGTGKTSLAREAGRRAAENFPAGVFFVDLQSVSDPTMVAPAIAHALGINEKGSKTVPDVLKLTLRDQKALLILDNFEQVLAAGIQISSLLRAAPAIKFIVTSREQLRLSAEYEYRVPPLALPAVDKNIEVSHLLEFDAVRMFVERAKRAAPDFELTGDNGPIVAAICTKLDGLPLALELAAARTRVLSAAEILARLDDRLALLTGGSRDLPGRQQTMRAAIAWSCDLLSEDEKHVFAALAVFEGGFTFKAAEAVVKVNIETLDVISALADKNLLMSKRSSGGDLRFWMLQIVRDSALELLRESGSEEESRRSHAEFLRALAYEAVPNLRTPEAAEWLDVLETEHDNFRTALRWSLDNDAELAAEIAASFSELWTMHGHIREAEHWLDEVLKRYSSNNTVVRWTVLTALGTIKQFRGELSAARNLYLEGLEAARTLQDQHRVARSLRGVAAVEYIGSDFSAALQHTQESLEITRAFGDDFGTAAALARLGDIEMANGNLEEAEQFTRKSLEIFRRLGYAQGVALKLSNLASVEILGGKLDEGAANLIESLAICLEIGDVTITRLVMDGFAALKTNQGQLEAAARIAGMTAKLTDTLGFFGEPAEERLKNHYLAKLHSLMDEPDFANAFAEGEKMSIEEAAALVGSG